MSSIPLFKLCLGCKIEKTLFLFSNSKKGKYGKKSKCKDCLSKEYKVYKQTPGYTKAYNLAQDRQRTKLGYSARKVFPIINREDGYSYKHCSVCLNLLKLDLFYKNKKGTYTAMCMGCAREKGTTRERTKKYNSKLHIERRLLLDKCKTVPCADCGYIYPPYVMDFDHLSDKKFLISKCYKTNINKLMEEISKCEVVCSNCHRIRTYNRKGS